MKTHTYSFFKGGRFLKIKNCFKVLLFTLLISLAGCTTESILEDEEAIETETGLAAKSAKSVRLNIQSVSASRSQNGNGPQRAIDNNTGTRWSGLGKSTNFDINLGNKAKIDFVKIAWFKGNQRKARFTVSVRENSNSSWQQINSKTSSGNTTGLQDFDLSDRNAQFLRLTCNGNTSNDWNSILELQVWGTPGGGSGPAPNPNPQPQPQPNSGSPAGNLGGLQNWKLNGYSGNLRIGAKNNGLNYVDKVPNLQSHSNPNWFYKSGSYTYFKAYTGNATSSGSGNPRSELRELTSDGRNNIFWNGTTGTTHRMKWTIRVERLPASGKVCFGQIHDKTDKFDDIVRVQFEGSGGQTSGSVKGVVKGYSSEDGGASSRLSGSYQLNTDYNFEMTMRNGIVTIFRNGQQVWRSNNIASKQNYFKAGCYLQSSKGKKAKNSNDFGLVGMRSISVSH